MQRVLMLTPREPWPLNGGGKLRIYHLARALAAHAEVTLAYAADAPTPGATPAGVRVQAIAADLTETPAARSVGLRDPWPLAWGKRRLGYSARLAAFLREQTRSGAYDSVLLHGARLGVYLPESAVPVVWDPTDELVLKLVRQARLTGLASWRTLPREVLFAAAFERWAARRAASTLFAAQPDTDMARRWVGAAPLATLPNGVDCDYFAPAAELGTPGTVAFVGSLSFPPNVDAVRWFAQSIWPALHARGVAQRFDIIGRQPVPDVLALAELPGVAIHADVPDVRPYLAAAAVLVVPTRQGGGIKNKVLEACAVRRPVVASRLSVGGLSLRPGRDVWVAEQPDEWIDAVTMLLASPPRQAQLAANGHAWVRQAHAWSRIGRELAAQIDGTTRAGARPGRPNKRPTPANGPLSDAA